MILVSIFGDGYGVIIFLILLVMFGPPVALLLIGLSQRKKNPDIAKGFYIMAVVYILISGGICASVMN